jgi:multidrug transporter EmrE-like cation transporter
MTITPVSSMLWVMSGSVIGSCGAVLLKGGAMRIERNIQSLLTNWRLGLGILTYVLSSLFFVRGLKEGELSILYPMVAVGYVFSLPLSKLFFNEPLTKHKVIALALILSGVAMLTQSASR